MKKHLMILFMCWVASTFCEIYAQETKWSWVGWGGGGFFWAAAFDPQDPNVLYMGGDVLGMYKSEDQAKTWRLINNGLHNYGVYSIAVSPSEPKVLYVMTVDGMARSDNAGESWIPLPETFKDKKNLSIHRHGSVRAVAVDPSDAKIVYAGSGQGNAFKSTDSGTTWQRLDFLSALKEEPGKTVPAARGAGFLWLEFESPEQDWNRHGRIELFLKQDGEDWSGYTKLAAKVLLPEASPQMNATLVLQTGDGWQWQESPIVHPKSGEWSEVVFDLSSIKNLESVRMLHLVIRSNGAAFQGEIGIDEIALTPKGAGNIRLLGDWNEPGNLEGWQATKAGDGGHAKRVRSSLAKKPVAEAPIASVVVSQADPNLVFVAHRRLGLFRSADGGKTWTHPAVPSEASHVSIHPKNGKLVYGAFGVDGIWKSLDGGATWKPTGNYRPEKVKAREVAIDPRDPETVHFIADNGWNGFFGTSRDGGKTWTTGRRWSRDRLSNPSLVTDLSKDKGGDLSTPTNLAMSPSRPDVLFISANWTNILSTDGGKSWVQRDQGADITCFHDIRFVGDSVFAVAMDEGLFRSDDNGKSWHLLVPKQQYEEGLSGHQWRVHARKKDDGRFKIVSTVSPWRGAREYPNGVLVSEDSGKTFVRGAGLPDYLPKADTMWHEGYARALAVDPQNPDTMYLGIDGDPENGKSGGGVFKSIDGGLNWKQLPNQPGSRRMFYGLAVDPLDSKRLYWGTGGNQAGVWLSEDGGDSWKRTLENQWVFNLDVTPSGTVYAGGQGLFRSRDRGKTWQRIAETKDGAVVVGIAFDPTDENRIWYSAVTWGESDRGGIFGSNDGGRTWKEITGDIPYKKPLVLRYNPVKRELWAVGVGAFKIDQ